LQCVLALAAALLFTAVAEADSPGRLPLLENLGFSTKQVEKIGTNVLTSELDVVNGKREAALVALVRIDPAGDEILDAESAGWSTLMDSPRAGGVYDSKAPDRGLGDLKLPKDDDELLASCRVESCRFKLDARGIQEAARATALADDPEALGSSIRNSLARVMREYEAGGPESLSNYADKPGSPSRSQPIRHLESNTQDWLQFYPELNRYLHTFPANDTSSVTNRFQWNLSSVGLRDTVLLEHVAWSEAGNEAGFGRAMALRTLYASHYLEARLQVAMVLDGPTLLGQPGTFLLTIDRVHFDEDVGFIKKSLLKRALSRKARERLSSLHQETRTAG
ncbi:hypothetical protein MK280_15545, partial [Myxococcota bacterium]|nr:hypothetical protein [Myxococcota bacterium]